MPGVEPLVPKPRADFLAFQVRPGVDHPREETFNAAVGAVESFVDDGLFWDRSTATNAGIVATLMRVAEAAEAARRLG